MRAHGIDSMALEKDRAALAQTRAQTAATGAQTMHAMGAERRAQEMHPLDILAKNRAIEASKYTPLKEGTVGILDASKGTVVPIPEIAGQGNKKFEDEAAKAQVKRYEGAVEAGDKAVQGTADMQQLRALADRVGDPSVSNTVKRVLGPYGRALGIPIEGMGDIEAFTAIMTRLAPQMRPPGSGATSDFEFKKYLESLPQLAQTRDGRKLIMDQFEAFSAHARARQDIAAKVLNGDIERRAGDRMMQSLPDPLTLWKQKTGGGGAGAPDADGWVTLPNGARIREKR
jgi:hypothetical protein